MRPGAVAAPFALTGSRRPLLLIAVLAVTAVVVGLLAMHSMAGGAPAHHALAPAPSSHTHGVDPTVHDADDGTLAAAAAAVPHGEHGPVPAVECDAACQMGCLMVGLICALALLAVLIAFLLPRIASMATGARPLPQRVARALFAGVGPVRPPSLTALSVSRT